MTSAHEDVATSVTATRLVLTAPLDGVVHALADVPDHVFSAGIAGPGVAIEPARPPHGPALAHAPVAGRLVTLFAHAFAVEPAPGVTVLVHLGIDTVRLAGEGFALYAAEGEEVALGDPVIGWAPDDVQARGLAALSPVVALQAEPDTIELLVEPGQPVSAGSPLFAWTVPTAA
ncbi:PTS glucose transporter subunit IIA [Luteimicrobium sp. NPDC057192]|uniref:PTS sugar transporter subunit IIA n=1 Tax=Luteimicrobium sp. NPDC057192 TaxID=3346042 RepID=UPI0036252119